MAQRWRSWIAWLVELVMMLGATAWARRSRAVVGAAAAPMLAVIGRSRSASRAPMFARSSSKFMLCSCMRLVVQVVLLGFPEVERSLAPLPLDSVEDAGTRPEGAGAQEGVAGRRRVEGRKETLVRDLDPKDYQKRTPRKSGPETDRHVSENPSTDRRGSAPLRYLRAVSRMTAVSPPRDDAGGEERRSEKLIKP